MVDNTDGLGGRLPLIDPATLTDAQREIFDLMMSTLVPWAEAAGFQSTTDDGRLIGPFNAFLFAPTVCTRFLQLFSLFTVENQTSLPVRLQEVVMLTVGAVWHADYGLYAHTAVARHAGLSEAAIATLAAGGEPEDLSANEKTAHRLARQLSTTHHVDERLYREAEKAFGAQGVLEITVLIGSFQTTCAVINVFDTPVPQSR